jgi:hypothetical protein
MSLSSLFSRLSPRFVCSRPNPSHFPTLLAELDSRNGTRQQAAVLILGKVDFELVNTKEVGLLRKVVERLQLFVLREVSFMSLSSSTHSPLTLFSSSRDRNKPLPSKVDETASKLSLPSFAPTMPFLLSVRPLPPKLYSSDCSQQLLQLPSSPPLSPSSTSDSPITQLTNAATSAVGSASSPSPPGPPSFPFFSLLPPTRPRCSIKSSWTRSLRRCRSRRWRGLIM